jgi:hypothetical protein
VRQNRFYLNPRLETGRFDLDAIAEEFQLPPRTQDDISPHEVCGILMSHRVPDPRLEAICDWKTQTVRQFALTLQQRFEGALICESGSTDREDQILLGSCAPVAILTVG